MFHFHGKLDPPLGPKAYSTNAFYELERAGIFGRQWHVVCLADDITRPGDYVAVEPLGVPVMCRNVDGEIRAFKNLCLHRHSRIIPSWGGHGERLRCQYHGWEYGGKGKIANHLFEFRKSCSLASTVEALGPDRLRFTSIGVLPREGRFPLLDRPIPSRYRRSLIRMARKITGEDVGIWSEAHSGLRDSDRAGVLGRVYAFQSYVVERTGSKIAEPISAPDDECAASDGTDEVERVRVK